MSNPVFLHPEPPSSPILAALGGVDLVPDRRCKAGRWLDQLDDGEVDEIVATVQRTDPTRVYRALAVHGFDGFPSETVWRRHWNSPCGCPQEAA